MRTKLKRQSISLKVSDHLSDSLEHVGDVTADSPHCCQLLFLPKPLLNLSFTSISGRIMDQLSPNSQTLEQED